MGRAAVIIVGLFGAAIYGQHLQVDEMWYWAAVLPATYLIGMSLLLD